MTESRAALRPPWLALARQREGVAFGVWVFLASEALFFGALFLAYAVYRNLDPEAFRAASRETNIVYGTVNTGILLTSSLTMAMAVEAAERGIRCTTLWCLMLTGLLGVAFLAVKGLEYYEDIMHHLVPGHAFKLALPAAQIFFALYWIMTGVHAIHLTIGIGAVVAVTIQAWRGAVPLDATMFEGLGLYWHLVDIIWVVLFPILYLVGRAG